MVIYPKYKPRLLHTFYPCEFICVGPTGLGSLCEGFKGCHKKCPSGTFPANFPVCPVSGMHFICEISKPNSDTSTVTKCFHQKHHFILILI